MISKSLYFHFHLAGDAGAMGSIIDEQQHQQNGTEEKSASRVGCAQLVRQQLEAAA